MTETDKGRKKKKENTREQTEIVMRYRKQIKRKDRKQITL